MEAIFSLIFMAVTSLAGSLEDGIDAYNSKDYEGAIKYFLQAAEKSDARAQYNLGNIYRRGDGVEQDYESAAKYYRLAAGQGYANSQFNLAILYARGRGVEQDNILSLMWFNLSAALGHETANNNRNKLSQGMSPEQIEEVIALSKQCLKSKYKDCKKLN